MTNKLPRDMASAQHRIEWYVRMSLPHELLNDEDGSRQALLEKGFDPQAVDLYIEGNFAELRPYLGKQRESVQLARLYSEHTDVPRAERDTAWKAHADELCERMRVTREEMLAATPKSWLAETYARLPSVD